MWGARARLWSHRSKEAESGLGAEAGLWDGTMGLGSWGRAVGSWEQEQVEPLVLDLLWPSSGCPSSCFFLLSVL